ncbi:aminoglycoside phosphotransferase family protein [Parasphingorhabdus cellanae]|uniref:Phosphotransferase n=1 Tax=Parasphingorhabdus cellanae TaxID=2806553 RepID=A0ABX7TAF3_9SPHN|nr:phosphotransferase [Parasphingorhabdus cellanae]QTD57644.1 phosphotransferase [Parasphingorhabdus cellanae]
MTPPAAAQDFLDNHGWGGAEILPVAGDASFRRYFRVVDGGRKAILMDAPPPHEDPRPFIHIARHLKAQNFAAPEIFGEDLKEGLVLLEDFGDHRMREHLDHHPEDEEAIYRRTIDLIKELHQKPAAKLPHYDWDQYLKEVNLLPEWYCPAQSLDVDTAGFTDAWQSVLQPVIASQKSPVTVLRDYHAENIMLLDDNRLGLLDFQDALAGHAAYDLVSMLQDARRDVSDELEEAMLEYYLDDRSSDEATQFRGHYAILGAQRNTKIIGIFTRLFVRDGKARYLDFLPRMWRLLEKDLAHPDLAPVANWFDQNVPEDVRSKPIAAVQA